ncbi:MAG: hypothetical protein HY901_36275, partial [Deltaproteobacteria bacterium]|nr:hypothetical protein [Deltaproteobacteria bacterium]
MLKDVQAAQLVVWAPKADGSFEARPADLKGDLKAGQDLTAKIATPYSLVTIGGFVSGAFKEGWAIAFVPAELKLELEVPAAAAPATGIKIGVAVHDATGAGAAVSGILEVYDNRVASRSPMSGLASALGDSVRSTSNSASHWQDRTGIDERAEREAHKQREKKEMAMEAEEAAPMAKSMAGAPRPSAPMKMAMPSVAAGGKGGATGARTGASPAAEEDEEQQEIIREGEKKVVFCDVVRTDPSGRALVDVTLPPQIGRVSVRFVAVRGLDHAATQKGVDVSKKASVEASLPKTFVPGTQLSIPLAVANTLQESVTLTA